jgi:hypothetical protein
MRKISALRRMVLLSSITITRTPARFLESATESSCWPVWGRKTGACRRKGMAQRPVERRLPEALVPALSIVNQVIPFVLLKQPLSSLF